MKKGYPKYWSMDLHYIVQREGQNQTQKTATLLIYGPVIQ